MRVDNIVKDVFFQETPEIKKGTRVTFTISVNSTKHLNDVFNKFVTHRVIKLFPGSSFKAGDGFIMVSH